MYRKPLAVFFYHFQCCSSDSMLSAVMLTGSSMYSVGSVVFPPRSLVRDRWVGFAPGRVPGCSFSSCIGLSSCEDFR